MVPMAPEELTGPERGVADPADPLRHAVQVALAIYLLPVIAIVCAIGGASILIGQAGQLAARFGFEGSRPARPGHLPSPRLESRRIVSRNRSRDWNRVGR